MRDPGVVHLAARTVPPVLALALVAGCTGTTPEAAPSAPTTTVPAVPSATRSPAPSPTGEQVDLPAPPDVPEATDAPQDVATGLTTPWGLAFLPSGAALITLRDPAEVVLLSAAGTQTLTGPGAEALADTRTDGEGGLLGVAISPDFADDALVYLYRTTAQGNEVVRARFDADTDADADAPTLGELEPVLTAIPAAGNHNGGRIAFGPDGHLYVATGDAGQRSASQDPDSLAGKILRVTADGEPAPGNPTEGSPVWSLGHRNVQGLGWDDEGRMFASEFGQNTFDELNVIESGGDYGWPQVEGRAGAEGMIDPALTWDPSVASPSGIAVTDDGVHLAALRGERLWSVGFLDDGFADAGDALVGELGRLRDVVQGPDGALWVLTNNTDGRGSPRDGDDRLVRVRPS